MDGNFSPKLFASTSAVGKKSAGERLNSTSGNKNYNICFSSSASGDMAALLGAPHYSYRFAEAKFISALECYGYTTHSLKMPEYYNNMDSFPPGMLRENEPTLHLIFRSTEQVRLLKFAWNVCCFAWEFDVLKDDTKLDEHPFLNQKRMLQLCDEIWVPCNYTKSVLDKYEIENTYVIPAPIDVYEGERITVFDALSHIGDIFVTPFYHNFLQSKEKNKEISSELSCTLVEYVARRLRKNRDTKIYLTILNPEDFRKNMDAMLRAFHYFSKNRDDAILVVKVLTSASRFTLLDVVSDVVPNKLDSGTGLATENIIFFNDYLSEYNMNCLYSMANFYLCCSICEGQNLPLLEAMGHGVLPVTTANTAMMDYISEDNAIIISDLKIPNDCNHFAGTIAGKPFQIRRSRSEDIYLALVKSASLSDKRYSTMSERARQAVIENFSRDVVCARIDERLAAISSRALAKAER